MLTNQLIGAAQNAASNSPRPSAPQTQAIPQPLPFAAMNTEAKAVTARPVTGTSDAKEVRAETTDERPPLEIPKRAEMRLLLVDTVPDAVPESIYDAKVTNELQENMAVEEK